MDYFTKWPEVSAIPNQENSTVGDKLFHEVFCRFGVPLEIHVISKRCSRKYISDTSFRKLWKKLRLPAHLITGIPPDAPRIITNYTKDLRNKMNDIYEHFRQSDQQISEKMKTRYDCKMNNKRFDEGSLVWLHNPVRSKWKPPKLQAKWDGL
ncbi:unnamed protein product [Parnassius mnemosyne]|uniref:Transposase n=1 Tax=Parnassius mnemosyne TaxID=213953 RepID=A0AAV1KGS0_9NEOP